MGAMASQITSLTVVYATIYSGPDQWKHQSSASLAYVWGIHRWPVNSPHKGPVTRNMFPFDDVIMLSHRSALNFWKALSKHCGLLLKKQLSGELVASVTNVCIRRDKFTVDVRNHITTRNAFHTTSIPSTNILIFSHRRSRVYFIIITVKSLI